MRFTPNSYPLGIRGEKSNPKPNLKIFGPRTRGEKLYPNPQNPKVAHIRLEKLYHCHPYKDGRGKQAACSFHEY